VIRRNTGKNRKLKYSLIACAGLPVFLAVLICSMGLLDLFSIPSSDLRDRSALLLPLVLTVTVILWGSIRCEKILERFNREDWEKSASTEVPLSQPRAVLNGTRLENPPEAVCVSCHGPIKKAAILCENCGYPFSGMPTPRTVKFRPTQFIGILLVVVVGYIIGMDFKARAIFPMIATKYFGSPAVATVTAVHCDARVGGKDLSWVEVDYPTPGAAHVRGIAGSRRSECSSTLIGRRIPIRYRQGGVVMREDGLDPISVPVSIVYLVLVNFWLPALFGFILIRSRDFAVNGTLHKVTVCDTYYKRAVDVAFEENGVRQVRKMAIGARERPPIGSTFWVLERGPKRLLRISGENLWRADPR
jgi:hypothetical protein